MKLSKHYSDKSTKVLGLGNLFDMNEVRSSGDPDFYKNLKEEVKEECQKYGTVRDMKIDKKKMIVYVRFEDLLSSQTVNEKLQDRVFSSKPIVTGYYSKSIFD